MAGSGGSRGSGGKKKARIEIIPLIDVIFFLLATFVLFTLSLNKSNGVTVTLPKVEMGVTRDTRNTVTISVTAEGAIAWEKTIIDLNTFIKNLEVAYRVDPDTKVLINADENSSFHDVFTYVLDQIRRVGFAKIYFETRSLPTGSVKS